MVDRHDKVLVATMRITTNTTPPETDTLGGQSEYWLNHLVVVIAAGKRPVSIPNLEAKPASADGTAPGRVWESRTPPQQPSMVGPGTQTVPGPTTFYIPSHRGAHHPQTFNTGATACLRSKRLVELDDVWYAPDFLLGFISVVRTLCWFDFLRSFSSLAMKATRVAFPQPLMSTSFISRSPLCWLGS